MAVTHKMLMEASRIVFDDVLKIKTGEKVAILTDRWGTDDKITNALAAMAREKQIVHSVIKINPSRTAGAPIPEAKDELLKHHVAIGFTENSVTHAKEMTFARKKVGLRAATSSRVTPEEFVAIAKSFAIHRKEMSRKISLLHKALEGANELHFKSKDGTDFRAKIYGRKWKPEYGNIGKPGEIGNFPSGEIFIAPIESSGNGRVVFHFSRPTGNIPAGEKASMVVKNGRIVSHNKHAGQFVEELEKNYANMLGEIGIGVLPLKGKLKKSLSVAIREKEKVHFAWGENTGFGGKNKIAKAHHDVVTNVDEVYAIVGKRKVQIMRNGKLLENNLRNLI